MITNPFLPPGEDAPDPVAVLRLLENCLTHACMWPSFKPLTGWRGLAVCVGAPNAWTCRIDARDGVYGMAPEAVAESHGWLSVAFGMSYFPTADEPLLECYAPIAALATADPAYLPKIRNFVDTAELSQRFRVARVLVAVEQNKQAVLLRLDASTRQRTMSVAGLKTGNGAWIVPPGGNEEDVPAFDLARDLFRVLTASVTFCTRTPSIRFARSSTPEKIAIHEASGAARFETAADVSRIIDSFVWGEPALIRGSGLDADMPTPAFVTAVPTDVAHDLCWTLHDPVALAADDALSTRLDTRPHLTILTGFLGSGKTTVLNQMVEYYRSHDRFVAVIQNELGASGVDQHLVDGGDTTITMDEGCACCTLSGGLTHGIHHLVERFHPEHIILETSGLANPLNLLAEIRQISHVARLSAVITVIDADNAPSSLACSELARDQVRGGDIIVINKCDLATDEAVDELCRQIRGLNERAPLWRTSEGKINPALLLDDSSDFAGEKPAFEASPHADHHAEGYSAIRIAQPKGLSRQGLDDLLKTVPNTVFRIKGILKLADSSEPEVLQCVGSRHELAPLLSEYTGEPFLVFIGQDMDEAALRAGF